MRESFEKCSENVLNLNREPVEQTHTEDETAEETDIAC